MRHLRLDLLQLPIALTVYLLAAVVAFTLSDLVHAQWTITQLTNNDYDDSLPEVSGSNVVWAGKGNLDPNDSSTDEEIFHYGINTGSTTQLTDNSYYDSGGPWWSSAKVSDSHVMWVGTWNLDPNDASTDLEVFLYDIAAGSITQVTDNGYDDHVSAVNGSNVVLTSRGNLDPNDPTTDYEIFLYDTTAGSITQVTDNGYDDYSGDPSGSHVVWFGEGNLDPNDPSTDPEIFLYDIADGSITQLTDNGSYDASALISGSNVVWAGWHEILLYDITDGSITQLTDSGHYHDVSGSNVVWADAVNPDPNVPSYFELEIFLYDITDGSITQITDNGYDDTFPKVSGSNVVWAGRGNLDPNDPSTDLEIFCYEIASGSITQLTDNSYDDGMEFFYPYVDGPGVSGLNVVWAGAGNLDPNDSSTDWEIFLASPTVPEPSSLALALVGLCLAMRRRR